MKTIALIAALAAAPAAAADREAFDVAIEGGLAYLARSQNPDGSWDAGDPRRPRFRRHPAVSALCVMAFMAAGHVPGEGPYGKAVEDGIAFVLNSQQGNGLITGGQTGPTEMYSHGICTLMLAEAVGMAPEPIARKLRAGLARAVEVVLKAQRDRVAGYYRHNRGGWRYRVTGADADLSVTGWQLMALRAAKNVGCDVPSARIESAVGYVRRSYDVRSGGYRYTIRPYPRDPSGYIGRVTVPCTGTGVLALELSGKKYHRSKEALGGGDYILNHPLRPGGSHFFYGVYYTSQAMFQLGDVPGGRRYWSSYRPKLHKLLLQDLPPRPGGHWYGTGWDDRAFGPNYCTAMAILALAVEYRFLPIYQRGEDDEGRDR